MENELVIAVLAALLSISELLAFIPSLKSNSVMTLVLNFLKAITGKKE